MPKNNYDNFYIIKIIFEIIIFDYYYKNNYLLIYYADNGNYYRNI